LCQEMNLNGIKRRRNGGLSNVKKPPKWTANKFHFLMFFFMSSISFLRDLFSRLILETSTTVNNKVANMSKIKIYSNMLNIHIVVIKAKCCCNSDNRN